MSSNVPALSKGVTRLENAIVTLSGPALATSGIIAGVDILTNNLIARYAPGAGAIAGLVWAICLMLTLDFQVLMLGVRARRIYASRTKSGWQKFGELVLCVAIASALGYVSLQMGSIFAHMLGTNLTIVQAQADLGINPIALIYERSALVLVLIFISGWLRDDVPADDRRVAQQPQEASTMTMTPDEIRSMIVDALTSVRVSVASVDTLQLPDKASSHDGGTTMGTDETLSETPESLNAAIARLEVAYQSMLTGHAEISASALAGVAHVRKATAIEWLRGKQQEQEE